MNWIKRHRKLLIGIAIFLILAIIGGANGDSKDHAKQASEAVKTQPAAQPVSPKSKLQELKDIAGSSATLFVANSPDLKEATSESEAPFKIVVNHADVIECSAAKAASYDVIKSLYTNNDVKSLVDQVVVTYPNRLVTSLGGDDGRATGSWSGETNFYKVMFDSFQVSQRDPVGQKTWVVSINNCN